MDEQKQLPQQNVQDERGKTSSETAQPKTENRIIAIYRTQVLEFKRKLEREFPVPTKFLNLRATMEVDPNNPQAVTYLGFSTSVGVAVGGERRRQGEYLAKVFVFTFPPYIPPQTDIEAFYILLTYILLAFHLENIKPQLSYVKHLDVLSLIMYEDDSERNEKKVLWEIHIPYRELLLDPLGNHSFLIYKKESVRIVDAKFYELPSFVIDF